MRRLNALKKVVFRTHVWALSTATSSARPVARVWQSARGTLATSNSHVLCFTLVCRTPRLISVSVPNPLRRFPHQSEKDPRVHLCKLWKTQSGYCECCPPVACLPIHFLGALLVLRARNPAPALNLSNVSRAARRRGSLSSIPALLQSLASWRDGAWWKGRTFLCSALEALEHDSTQRNTTFE